MEKFSIKEAFQEFNSLTEEETFNLDDSASLAKKLNDFFSGDCVDDLEFVVDLEASSKDELKDSYVGDIIIECPICRTKFYKDEESVKIEETDDNEELFCNVSEECPQCHSLDGYKVVGRVSSFDGKEDEKEEEKKEVSPEEEIEEIKEYAIKNESLKSKKTKNKKGLKEALFYGIPDVYFIWHGEWASPEILYNDHFYSYYDVEDTLWDIYQGEFPGVVKDDEGFEEWIKSHDYDVYEILDTTLPKTTNIKNRSIYFDRDDVEEYGDDYNLISAEDFSDFPHDVKNVWIILDKSKRGTDQNDVYGLYDAHKEAAKEFKRLENIEEGDFRDFDESLKTRKSKAKKEFKKVSNIKESVDYKEIKSVELDGEDYIFTCWAEGTRNGFRHVCDLYVDGYFLGTKTVNYLNRTYERYQYQTVIRAAVNKLIKDMDTSKKEELLKKVDGLKESRELKDFPNKEPKKEITEEFNFEDIVNNIENKSDKEIAKVFQEIYIEKGYKACDKLNYMLQEKGIDCNFYSIDRHTWSGDWLESFITLELNGDKYDIAIETSYVGLDDEEQYLDYEEVEILDLDEKLFDNLAEQFAKEIYENVQSYKTTSGKVDEKNNQLILEGKIKFKSGKEKNTKFIFEGKEMTKRGKTKLVGLNETFSSSKKAFTLQGYLNNKEFLPESLTYNYKTKNNSNKSTVIYGRVENKLATKK